MKTRLNRCTMLLVAVTLILTLAGCVERQEEEYVTGTVIDMAFDQEEMYYKTMQRDDGSTYQKKVYEPAEWEVTVKYEDLVTEFEFGDDSYFNSVKTGDEVQLVLRSGYNKKEKLVIREITLPEKY